MMNIICAADLSETSFNAIRYAAGFAKAMQASLRIVNIVGHLKNKQAETAIYHSPNSNVQSELLQNICKEINATYNVSCNYVSEASSESLNDIINQNSEEGMILIIGSDGTDNIYKYIFSSPAHRTVKRLHCPVLLIPADYKYQPLKKIVFTWDLSIENQHPFKVLNHLINNYEPELTVLQMTRKRKTGNDEMIQQIRKEISGYLDKKIPVTIERIYLNGSKTFAKRLNYLTRDIKADLLAITIYNRDTTKNIFHGIVTRELCELAWYPILVIHA